VEGALRADLILPHTIPTTPEELAKVKDIVHSTEHVYGRLVSIDDKAAMVSGGFHEGRLDYTMIFDKVRKIIEEESDDNTEIYVAGPPMLTGWVFHYQHEMYYIFAATIAIMVVLLIYYFRRSTGIIFPLLAAAVSSIWGLGFASLLGLNIDPLIMVIPLLISARCISHCAQLLERFQELYEETRDTMISSKGAMADLFLPGVVGVIADFFGILIILVATVRQMQIMAIFCSFWVLSIIFSVQIVVPLLLSYFPPPKHAEIRKGLMDKGLEFFSELVIGKKGRWLVVGVTAAIAVWCFILGEEVQIGDVNPGSPLLWPDSPYNISAAKINESFFGADKLSIFVDGPPVDYVKYPEKAYLRQPAVLKNMEKFRKYMEEDPKCGGSMALPDIVKGVTKVYHFNDRRWFVVPEDAVVAGNYIFMYQMGSAVPGSLAEFTDFKCQSGNLIFFYKDHMNKTVTNAVNRAKDFIKNHSEGVQYKLAGGNLGVLAATNEEIERVNWITLVLVFVVIYILIAICYQSLTSGVLLLCSLGFANLVTLGYMVIKGIGLDVNTLPVACVGVGIGVDYSVYIIDRIKLECSRGLSELEAIRVAIVTTGRAVSFTATTMVGGIIMWYFLSSLRFQAEMSILLSILMIVNAAGAVILVPALCAIVKPKFAFGKIGGDKPTTAK
jgi:predicted RND superfamily exporter protein